MRNRNWTAFLTAILTVAVTVFAEPAATRPTDQIAKWFEQLADANPTARDAARINLMGLTRDELEPLRKIVEQHRPLAPEQSAGLRDIVTHVFLTGEEYEKSPFGFLGVILREVHLPPVADADEQRDPNVPAPPAPGQANGRDGVLVTQRVPGFCGFRFLQDNDIVIGVLGADLVALPRGGALTELVKSTAPGDTITLQIVRQGKVIRLSFPVDARPLQTDRGDQVEEFRNPRLQKAAQYWQATFAPLLAKLS